MMFPASYVNLCLFVSLRRRYDRARGSLVLKGVALSMVHSIQQLSLLERRSFEVSLERARKF